MVISTNEPRKPWQRAVAAIVVVAMLAVLTLDPAPARADSTDTLIYVGIGVAAYVALIVVATTIIYGAAESDSAIPLETLYRNPVEAPGVHAGTSCAQRDGQLTLFCW